MLLALASAACLVLLAAPIPSALGVPAPVAAAGPCGEFCRGSVEGGVKVSPGGQPTLGVESTLIYDLEAPEVDATVVFQGAGGPCGCPDGTVCVTVVHMTGQPPMPTVRQFCAEA